MKVVSLILAGCYRGRVARCPGRSSLHDRRVHRADNVHCYWPGSLWSSTTRSMCRFRARRRTGRCHRLVRAVVSFNPIVWCSASQGAGTMEMYCSRNPVIPRRHRQARHAYAFGGSLTVCGLPLDS